MERETGNLVAILMALALTLLLSPVLGSGLIGWGGMMGPGMMGGVAALAVRRWAAGVGAWQ
jgi:hypothetical protein